LRNNTRDKQGKKKMLIKKNLFFENPCFQQSDNSAINIVKVRTHFADVEPEVLYDVLHDHEYRAVWDPNMIEGKVIVQLDPTNEIGYYSAKVRLVFEFLFWKKKKKKIESYR